MIDEFDDEVEGRVFVAEKAWPELRVGAPAQLGHQDREEPLRTFAYVFIGHLRIRWAATSGSRRMNARIVSRGYIAEKAESRFRLPRAGEPAHADPARDRFRADSVELASPSCR